MPFPHSWPVGSGLMVEWGVAQATTAILLPGWQWLRTVEGKNEGDLELLSCYVRSPFQWGFYLPETLWPDSFPSLALSGGCTLNLLLRLPGPHFRDSD